MTLNVTVPDTTYCQIVEMAAQQQVSVERIVAVALAEQLAGWSHARRMAELSSRERFLAPNVFPAGRGVGKHLATKQDFQRQRRVEPASSLRSGYAIWGPPGPAVRAHQDASA